MTITHAIRQLEHIKEGSGDVEVFFDCPHCGKSTAPDYVVVVKERVKAVLVKDQE
jgi:hypothetical protein